MKQLLACSLVLAIGCGVEDPEDGHDESYLSGRGLGDLTPLEEGTILSLVNTLSDQALRDPLPDGAGLGDPAVDNLIHVRLGDDGLLGSLDDGYVDTIEELDAVPFIGPIEFEKLLAYAREHGF
jgi:hypothetical protein